MENNELAIIIEIELAVLILVRCRYCEIGMASAAGWYASVDKLLVCRQA